MTLSDALRLAQDNARRDADPFRIRLVTGSTPNPLGLFVTAFAAQRWPDRRAACDFATYGDIVQGLDESCAADAHLILIVLEWADLDPRLGLRRFAIGVPETGADISRTADERLRLIAEAISRLNASTPVALALPSLELPPVFLLPDSRMGRTEAALRRRLLEFAEICLERENLRIVSAARLDRLSPPSARRSASGELGADLPYQSTHMSALAQGLIEAAAPPPRLKGLITDLDDTLWKGLVGEIGPENVSWSLEDQSQIHGVYQQMLSGLASQGVLLAVASKNSAELALPALERADLRLRRDSFYPVEIGWDAKSSAIERILSVWNLGADAVAFVDDSAMEIEEARAAFPDMPTFLFPREDEGSALELIERLRNLFSRDSVTAEDGIRVSSLRRSGEIRAQGSTSLDFLKGLSARLTFDFHPSPQAPRPLELINKTNQFNINGRRIEAADWARRLNDDRGFAVTVSYEDRLGPLGAISVAAGRIENSVAILQTWVLSCRAFARRIEHVILETLRDRLAVKELQIDYVATEKNLPLQTFLRQIGAQTPTAGSGVVSVPELPPTDLHERIFREPS